MLSQNKFECAIHRNIESLDVNAIKVKLVPLLWLAAAELGEEVASHLEGSLTYHCDSVGLGAIYDLRL